MCIMKSLIYIVIPMILISSCKEVGNENLKSEQIHFENDKSIESNEKADISSLIPIIQGIWLPKEYVENLHKTKSAYIASSLIPEIAELQINPDEIVNDTLYVGSSIGNHEGYGFNIWFTSQNGKIIIQSDIYEWKADKKTSEFVVQTKPDTIIKLVIKNQNGEMLKTIEYIKVRNKEHITNFGGLGYNYMARRVLLNGTYEILDSSKSNMGIINFDAENEMITNFKYKFYTIQTDFGGGPSYEDDHVTFQAKKDDYHNSETYVIKKEMDTIVLYTTEEIISDSGYSIELKDKVYYLIKK